MTKHITRAGALSFYDADTYHDDDWEYATRSEEIAEVLIDALAEKVRDVTGQESGQQKTIWARVIAEFHAAYYERFLERVVVDDGKPASTR